MLMYIWANAYKKKKKKEIKAQAQKQPNGSRDITKYSAYELFPPL